VVTYITYLDVDNSDLSLRPGMTATATITAKEKRCADRAEYGFTFYTITRWHSCGAG
jgi:hypothetical protein